MVGNEEIGWMCILGAAPFAACGFFKYHGMTAEKLAWGLAEIGIPVSKEADIQIRLLLL